MNRVDFILFWQQTIVFERVKDHLVGLLREAS